MLLWERKGFTGYKYPSIHRRDRYIYPKGHRGIAPGDGGRTGIKMDGNQNQKRAGRFSIVDGRVSGPRIYIFNVQFLPQCEDVEMAVLVYLQTDFAGWMGEMEMKGWAGVA